MFQYENGDKMRSMKVEIRQLRDLVQKTITMNIESNSQIKDLKIKVNDLESCDKNLRSEIDDLQHENQKLRSDMKKRTQILKTEIEDLKSRPVSKTPGFSDANEALVENSANVNQKIVNDTFITFRAFPLLNRIYNTDEILIFDEIHVNNGGHFVNDTTFVCPVSGYYLFCVSLHSSEGRAIEARLTTDDVTLHDIYADGDEGLDFPMASASVVNLCDVGQEVKVLAYGYSRTLRGMHLHSSFSGTLLSAA